ncbi:acyltransferase family protein [Collimonas fungivorans]|uniref:Acyltransferase family protein n=1 Tax=Collimonas fungivorans TaxID=158899 RepID=A0A127PE34_9BURK|nr:acyltransferase family protein [Collimonas fungivorans]AMO96066.1 acyltransferase family protein [Collimonas fungivorans]
MSFFPSLQRSSLSPGAAARYVFIDNAKAIGIVLIVVGHSKGLSDYMVRLLFSFHVPLFFFISGFLLKPDKLNESVYGNAKKILRTLAWPYFLFFCFAYLYWLATRNIGAKAALSAGRQWYDPIAGLLTGLEPDLYINPPLWFFPCLVATVIMYQAARKLLNLTAATCWFVILGFAVTLAVSRPPYRLLLGLDTMWVALSFYAIGQHVRERAWFDAMRIGPLLLAALAAAALLVGAGQLNDRVDLATMYFGTQPLLYLPVSLFGIVAVVCVSKLLPASRIAGWLSENTLVIFPAHFVFLGLVRGAALSLHIIDNNYRYGIGWCMVCSALAILLCIPVVYVWRRLPK